jgi:hypothetical protein
MSSCFRDSRFHVAALTETHDKRHLNKKLEDARGEYASFRPDSGGHNNDAASLREKSPVAHGRFGGVYNDSIVSVHDIPHSKIETRSLRKNRFYSTMLGTIFDYALISQTLLPESSALPHSGILSTISTSRIART